MLPNILRCAKVGGLNDPHANRATRDFMTNEIRGNSIVLKLILESVFKKYLDTGLKLVWMVKNYFTPTAYDDTGYHEMICQFMKRHFLNSHT